MPRNQADPIFAAIAAHGAAHDAFSAEAAFLAPRRRSAKYAAEWEAVRAAYRDATDALVSSEIITVAGAQAFAAYLGALRAYGGGKHFPCAYSVEVWHLSDAMARIGEALAKHSPRRGRAAYALPTPQALPAWTAQH